MSHDPIGDALASFDPLDDRFRWCIYCGADCWPEPDNQNHDLDCPMTTGLYPITSADLDPWGGYGSCCLCHVPFGVNDLYMLIDDNTGHARTGVPSAMSWVVCLGCAATGGDPRPWRSGGRDE